MVEFKGIGDITQPDGVEYSRKPKVAIIMTTYNRAQLLERAIKSIVAQTYSDWFLYVVDDGSTDGTLDALDRMMILCENRMAYLIMPENSGKKLGKVRNAGIKFVMEYIKPELISFIDDDNEYEPTYLEEMVKQLDLLPHYDVAYCDSTMYKESGVLFVPFGVTRSVDFDPKTILSSNYIDLGEAMVRAKVFEKFGLFEDDHSGCGEDWGMWCKLAQNGVKFVHYPKALYKYYLHAGQTTHAAGHQEILAKIRERVSSGWYLESGNWVR